MKKENLVTLKRPINFLAHGHSTFKRYQYYRCIPDVIDNETKGYIIYGEYFTLEEYAQHFDLAYDRIIADFKALGLVDSQGKAVSKTAFKKLADIHTYSNGRKAGTYHIWYFRDSRERIYGFYPMQGNQKDTLNELYDYLLQVCNEDMTPVDEKDICFGNRGIPIGYGILSVD